MVAASRCVMAINRRGPIRSSDAPSASVTLTVGSRTLRSCTASSSRWLMRSARNWAV